MSDAEDTAELITRLNAKAIVEAYRAGKDAGQAERELLREALAWARGTIIHGITESDREELYSVTMEKIDAALQEDRDD